VKRGFAKLTINYVIIRY